LKFRSNPTEDIRRTRKIRRFFPYSVNITRAGLLYLFCVLFLSLAAVNSGNNLLFVLLAILLSVIVVSGIISRSSLRQLSLSLRLPENVFVGEMVSVKVTLKNLKWLFPSFSIRVEDPELSRDRSFHSLLRKLIYRGDRSDSIGIPSSRTMFRQAAYFPILRAGETRSELTMQSFPSRGLYSLQGFWISTCFPFGFFRRGEYVGAKGEILVYPLIQEVSPFFRMLPYLPGHLESQHAGQGENLFSIRKYQESESARALDWKATAKTGELMAREFAREEESRFCLILDTRIVSREPALCEIPFEKAVSLAASLAAHFLGEGAEIELLTPQVYVPCGAGIDHLYRILGSLAVARYEAVPSWPSSSSWNHTFSSVVEDTATLKRVFSDKVFKIIISSQPKGSFPSAIWRSSHVVFFDEL
jgi:uncharacterized protein (DUF58 family)